MNSVLCFSITMLAMAVAFYICDRKFNMLRDTSTANVKPYSFARVQLAWWTIIIASALIAILFHRNEAPDFYVSTLILLGISSATTAAARVIDISDRTSVINTTQHQNQAGEGFFLDILSDAAGVSIHRFQTVVFNAAFGIWFIRQIALHIGDPSFCVNAIIPDISDNALILLGLSSGTYATLKATENKTK